LSRLARTEVGDHGGKAGPDKLSGFQDPGEAPWIAGKGTPLNKIPDGDRWVRV
jgi:hypothetical protein